MNQDVSLSEVIEYFKKNQISSFEDEIDTYGNYFITAARLAAVVLAPSPLTALSNFCSGIDTMSLRVSKLFSWLPEKCKYGNKGREKLAKKRYELSSIVYVKLLNIAILSAFKDELQSIFEELLTNAKVDDLEKKELKRIADEAESSQLKISIDTYSSIEIQKIKEIVDKIVDPILPLLAKGYTPKIENKEEKLDIDKVKKRFVDKSYTLFNAFLINLSIEFPEFTLWYDTKQKDQILKELEILKEGGQKNSNLKSEIIDSIQSLESNTKIILGKLETLNKDSFLGCEGFSSFESIYVDIFKVQSESILDKLDEKTKNYINAHHNSIKSEIDSPLSDNDDIPEIVYPKNKNIYIAQGYQSVIYNKKEHRRLFLTASDFDKISKKGEDVGKLLLEVLANPNSNLKPIIILGNPGAGKSMFSKMFTAKLCDTVDYIPFLVRLRDVASSSSNISEHINKGIAKTVGLQEINWIEWAKLFKTRIPVILLDGFDELMQSSSIELNGYINSIKALQETAMHNEICLKVILTSRIAVMQDVSIPDGTFIIKLNIFDTQRKNLWVNKWNSFQTKNKYLFNLPNDKKISELSQEPLLLFMLAVYDFPSSELQKITSNDSFNQSKLYDSLLNSFGLRQLEKEYEYSNGNLEHKKKEEEMFRLRLGLISLLMFLTDSTNKDISRLDEELRVCKLDSSKIKPIDVLTGFFFVHQNKSTSENEIENYNYEFLHKSFGEFLAADFLLRIAFKQKDRQNKDIELFRFCFGYNWLHKHPEIQRFLFEHAPHVFNPNNNDQERIVEAIQDALEGLFDKSINDLPISRFTIIPPKSKIEHIAIYSQNLIFLWVALNEPNKKIEFDISASSITQIDSRKENEEVFNFISQDRDEIEQSKLHWKRITYLWQLVGNNHSVAKLNEWINVVEEDKITLLRRKERIEIKNNFSESSLVSCNDFNFLMSLFDIENKYNYENLLNKLSTITNRKPEFRNLYNEVLLFRLSDVALKEQGRLAEFFNNLLKSELSPKQYQVLVEKFIFLSKFMSDNHAAQIGEAIFVKIYKSRDIFAANLLLLNHLSKFQAIPPVDKIFLHKDEVIERVIIETLQGINEENLFIALNAINELYENSLMRLHLHPKLVVEIGRVASRGFKYIVLERPSASIEYLKLLKNFGDRRLFREHFDRDVIQEVIERLFSELRHGDSSAIQYEYIKVINELISIGDFREVLSPHILEELVHRVSRDFKYIVRENPSASIEYLKLLKNFGDKRFLREHFDRGVIQEIIERLFSELRHGDSSAIQYTYIKVVNELIGISDFREVLSPHILEELVHRVSREFKYIVRENSSASIEYLKLLKNLGGRKLLREHFDRDVIQEVIERLFSELRHRNSSTIQYEYIKVINELISIGDFREVLSPHILDELVHRASQDFKYIVRENPSASIEYLKLFKILNRVELIADNVPQLHKIYNDDPKDFLKYFEALINIFSNEARN